MNPLLPHYRKLGGWLMFINVMSIIGIVVHGLNVLSSFFSFFALGFSGSMFAVVEQEIGIPGLFQSFTGLYNFLIVSVFVLSLILLATCICRLVFLQKRQLKPFKVAFFAGYGASIIYYVIYLIYFAVNPLGTSIQRVYEQMQKLPGYQYDPQFDVFWKAQMDYINGYMLAVAIICLVIGIGLAVAFFFYFQRSRRVKVYFDPNYVDPPYTYTPPASQAVAYAPPQQYAQQPRAAYPQGYPAGSYPQPQSYPTAYAPQQYSYAQPAPQPPYPQGTYATGAYPAPGLYPASPYTTPAANYPPQPPLAAAESAFLQATPPPPVPVSAEPQPPEPTLQPQSNTTPPTPVAPSSFSGSGAQDSH